MKTKRTRINKKVRTLVFTRDKWSCLKCGSTQKLTIDHIKALADGGTNDLSNLQTLCEKCNTSKGTRKINHRTQTEYSPKQQKNDNNGIYGILHHGDQRLIIKK